MFLMRADSLRGQEGGEIECFWALWNGIDLSTYFLAWIYAAMTFYSIKMLQVFDKVGKDPEPEP